MSSSVGFNPTEKNVKFGPISALMSALRRRIVEGCHWDQSAGHCRRGGAGKSREGRRRRTWHQFVSPYSVLACFALVYPGAGGTTAREIATAFGFDDNAQIEAQRTRARADGIRNETGGSELNIATPFGSKRPCNCFPPTREPLAKRWAGALRPYRFGLTSARHSA